MKPIVHFEQVSKRYRLQRNRPRSFREWFVRWRPRWANFSTADSRVDWLWAVRDVSFTIYPGETVGLIGSNGAGKSTVLKLISQIISPSSGRVEVNGRVGALLELGTGFHPELSGRDNIFLSGALAGMSRLQIKQRYPAIVEFSELEEFIDMPVKHYSSGMFARLAFAVSIHLDPEVLLVDEVLAVGDHNFQTKCLTRIEELQRAGVTICFVSHSFEMVRQICSRAIWVDQGHLKADGKLEMILPDYLDRARFSGPRSAARNLGPRPDQRWGSGQIEIGEVRLTDEHGLDRTTYETGEALILEIHYVAREPTPFPVFGMAIHRQDGVHITGPNTSLDGLVLPTISGKGVIKYVIADLCLLDGVYLISVSAHSPNGQAIYDYHDRVYKFRVTNTGRTTQERYGLITTRGRWLSEALETV